MKLLLSKLKIKPSAAPATCCCRSCFPEHPYPNPKGIPCESCSGWFSGRATITAQGEFGEVLDPSKLRIAGFPISVYLESMKTTIDIPDKTLEDAIRFTGAKTKREAVVKALDEFNRQQRVQDLIASFGTLDFASNEEIEAGDLEEIALREARGGES